jgi:TP901 family phage tail tape measure protein
MARERATLAALNGATEEQIAGHRRAALGYANMARRAEDAARAHDAVARAADASSQRHRHMISVVEQGGQALATAGVGLVAFGAVTLYAMKSFIDVAVEYERQVKHTATQIDGFKGNLQELGDIGRRVANDIALPFESIQPALFDIFSSTEANTRQAELLLRAFAKAAVAGQVDIQEASRATVGVLNAFGRPLEDVNKVLDMQFQLVQEGVGTYQEWAEKIGLVSPSAARAGQSIEVMMAALATATRMGMSAARATTSVARAFDAISNPKVIKNLKGLGISALDATGHMRPFNDVLRDLRTVINKLPEKDRVGAILEIFKGAGSTIEARRFLQTMLLVPGTLETFDSILGEVKNSAGSLDAAYGLMADTAAAKTEMLRNKWKLLQESLGRALIPTFISIINWVMKLLDKFNGLSPAMQKAVAAFLIFSTAIAIVGGIILILVGALAGVIAAFVAAGSVLLVVLGGALALVAGLAALAAAFIYVWKHSANFRMMLQMVWEDIKVLWGIASSFAASFSEAFRATILPALQELWGYIEEWVLPAFISFREEMGGNLISTLQTVGQTLQSWLAPVLSWIGDLITGVLLPAIKGLTDKWNENKATLMPFISVLFSLAKASLVAIAVITLLAGAGVLGLLIAVVSFVISVVQLMVQAWGWGVDAFNMAKAAVNRLIDIFKSLGKSVSEHISLVLSLIRSLPGAIQNAVGDLGSVLVSAGRAVIQGLIRGVEQAIPGLGTVLSGVGKYIADHKGPLDYDRKILVPAGKAVMTGLMTGIESQFPALLNQLNGINSTLDLRTDLDSDGQPSFRRPDLQPAPAPVVNKYYNITQNITTQEVSPQRAATQLGWEVTTVM